MHSPQNPAICTQLSTTQLWGGLGDRIQTTSLSCYKREFTSIDNYDSVSNYHSSSGTAWHLEPVCTTHTENPEHPTASQALCVSFCNFCRYKAAFPTRRGEQGSLPSSSVVASRSCLRRSSKSFRAKTVLCPSFLKIQKGKQINIVPCFLLCGTGREYHSLCRRKIRSKLHLYTLAPKILEEASLFSPGYQQCAVVRFY